MLICVALSTRASCGQQRCIGPVQGPPRPPWRGYLMTRTGIHKSSSSSVEKELLAILLQPYMAIFKKRKAQQNPKEKEIQSKKKKRESKI